MKLTAKEKEMLIESLDLAEAVTVSAVKKIDIRRLKAKIQEEV